jgi:hypothetical protein
MILLVFMEIIENPRQSVKKIADKIDPQINQIKSAPRPNQIKSNHRPKFRSPNQSNQINDLI